MTTPTFTTPALTTSAPTTRAMTSRTRRLRVGLGAVVLAATPALASCGSAPVSTTGTEVVATDYVTLPPPTTTTPPTTTLPPQEGSVITSEATYVVVAGDYPFQVAARFGVDFEEFVELNGWTIDGGEVPEWPAPGTTIRIPAGAIVPGGPSVLEPVPTTTTIAPEPGAGSSLPPDATGDPGGSTPATDTTVDDGVGCGVYTVMEGDYLSLVADKLDTTVERLAAANADTDGYAAFYVGLVINVPC